jgi:hypothetical protein
MPPRLRTSGQDCVRAGTEGYVCWDRALPVTLEELNKALHLFQGLLIA